MTNQEIAQKLEEALVRSRAPASSAIDVSLKTLHLLQELVETVVEDLKENA